jgi:hypothetical protein
MSGIADDDCKEIYYHDEFLLIKEWLGGANPNEKQFPSSDV